MFRSLCSLPKQISYLLLLGFCLVVASCAGRSIITPTLTRPLPKAAAAPVETRIRPVDEAVMVYAPAGEFLMGSSDAEITLAKADCPNCPEDWFDGEQPQHSVYLDAYWIDMYEVTNAQYAKFITAGGYDQRDLWTAEGWQWKMADNRTQPRYWEDADWNKPDYPVVGVVWFEALAYCRWAGARLPSEAEWERAAGWDGQKEVKTIYPWGNDWDPARLNTVESALGGTTPVGYYCPQAASPVGACDMVGNAWEWMSSVYRPYPYRADDGREELETHGTRVLRGGSWINERDRARVAYRLPPFPGDFILFDPTNGFRCAMPAE